MVDLIRYFWRWTQAPEQLSQNFTANVALERANGGIKQLTIKKIIGKVDATIASKDFEMNYYKRLDFTALRLGVAMGCKALVRVETEDGRMPQIFELLGVRKENKKVKMTVKAIKGRDMRQEMGLLKKQR